MTVDASRQPRLRVRLKSLTVSTFSISDSTRARSSSARTYLAYLASALFMKRLICLVWSVYPRLE